MFILHNKSDWVEPTSNVNLVCKMNVFLNFTGNVLVVDKAAGHYAGDEEYLGREPSQALPVEISNG